MIVHDKLEDVHDCRINRKVRYVKVSSTLLLIRDTASKGRVIQVLLSLASTSTYV